MTENKPQILLSYITYLDTIRGRAAGTVNEYILDITFFLKYIYAQKNNIEFSSEIDISSVDKKFLESIKLSDIYNYLNYMSRERDTKASTRSRKIASIRSFFKYLTTKAGILEHNPCDTLETPKLRSSLPKYLNLEQSIELLSAASGDNKERDFCMIMLFLTCGMRLSELVGLNLSDIKGDHVKVLGKGNKERIIYINDACKKAIEDYLTVRCEIKIKNEAKNALFISRLGKRIGTRSVQQMVEKNLAAAGLGEEHFTTHKLRHTAATLMFRDGGVDVRTLQEILGHAQLNTTQIYTHVSDKQMQKAASANPLSKVTKEKLKK